ncbi:hypothetical protein HC931_18275 [Candidatus Gracilibacteria bacterium]|nr:hypothetical protein [Candidatus Gracilibacteria bacterium]
MVGLKGATTCCTCAVVLVTRAIAPVICFGVFALIVMEGVTFGVTRETGRTGVFAFVGVGADLARTTFGAVTCGETFARGGAFAGVEIGLRLTIVRLAADWTRTGVTVFSL